MGSFRSRLGLVALLGLAVRLLAAYLNRNYPVIGDAMTYHVEGGLLAHGEGFRRVFEDVPTAEHPPAHIVVVAFADLLGLDSTLGQKAFQGVLGTGTVVLIGLLGRRVAGERAGLIAGVLAAVYPMLWLADAALMSETTSTLLAAACVLAAYGLRDRRSPGAAAALGALIGLAALARGELLALLVLLLLPLAWAARGEGGTRRALVLAGTGVVAFAVVLAPWTIRNARTFDAPVALSTNGDAVFAGANCPASYDGPRVGSWIFACFGPAPPGDEAQMAKVYRRRGLDYASKHAGRLPVVVAARLGRVLDVYQPWTGGLFFAAIEGRQSRFSKAGLLMYWALLPLGFAGALVLRRRGESLLILLAPVALVLVVAAAVYGSTRFRMAAEPSLVVLAAVALDAAWRRRRVAA